MLGYTRAEYVNLSLTDIEAVESKKEEITAHIEKIVRQGSDIFETKHRKKDGTICDVLVSVKLISVAGKQYIQGVWRDITMLKKDQRELLEDRMQLKQLTSQLALTEERQRRKIASELHDLLSQSLALAKVKLDIIRATAQGQLQTELTDVADTLQSLIDQTRTLVFDISSPILYELGFEAAVAEWLNEQIRIKHGIYAEFQDDGRPKPLDDDVKVLLFRNVRELLINIIKYAHADKVNVSIRRTNDSIEITVMDNGVGFDTGQVKAMVAKFEKFGLFGIRESVEQLGGRFDIESKPGAGCTATIVAPLKRKE
jgi:signal transduction histidine kinase